MVFHKDVTDFKLKAAEYHLENLKRVYTEEGISGGDRNPIYFEVHAFTFQITSIFDSLNQEINEVYKLGLEIDDVDHTKISTEYKNQNKPRNFMREFEKRYGNQWATDLRELNSHLKHRGGTGVEIVLSISSPSKEPKIEFYLKKDKEKGKKESDYKQKGIIPEYKKEPILYCETTLNKMREFVQFCHETFYT